MKCYTTYIMYIINDLNLAFIISVKYAPHEILYIVLFIPHFVYVCVT